MPLLAKPLGLNQQRVTFHHSYRTTQKISGQTLCFQASSCDVGTRRMYGPSLMATLYMFSLPSFSMSTPYSTWSRMMPNMDWWSITWYILTAVFHCPLTRWPHLILLTGLSMPYMLALLQMSRTSHLFSHFHPLHHPTPCEIWSQTMKRS